MASFNKTMLMGNLCSDPEVRFTSGGTSVCEFRLAVNRKWKSGEEDKEDVLYISVTAWGKLGDVAGKYLNKGRPCFVEGFLKLDQWETNDGQKRSKIGLVAQSIQFLGSGEDRGDKPSGQQQQQSTQSRGGTVERGGGAADDLDQIPF